MSVLWGAWLLVRRSAGTARTLWRTVSRGAVVLATAAPSGSGVAAPRPAALVGARSRPGFDRRGGVFLAPLPVALVLLLAMATTAQAHIASNGFLTLNVEGSRLSGAVELAMRDVELAVGLDANRDGRITWGEVRAHQRDLELYMRRTLVIGDGATRCLEEFAAVEINERVDGNYVWLPFTAACGSSQLTKLSVDYRLMQDIDPSHRGLMTITAWGTTQTAVLHGEQSIALDHPSAWLAFTEYLKTGVWHIWSGIDHLLFLLSLLLPAVLRRRDQHWEAVPLAKPAFLNILKVVTAFTVAHSVTLSLAALDVVRLPSRLTESVIAASIIVAALNNIFPRVTAGRWRIAFAFGLLHGFGFASVLADMGLPPGARALSLVSFNLGVETGQLAVVSAVMPMAYAIRTTRFYRQTVMQWGSSAIAVLAFVWLIQRAVG
jgi:hypothetical protein